MDFIFFLERNVHFEFLLELYSDIDDGGGSKNLKFCTRDLTTSYTDVFI